MQKTLDIRTIFTDKIIQDLRMNKSKISSDLLTALRSHDKEGKQIALDILDLNKDHEQYYLDAFNNRISFNGNRRLKKAYTKLELSEIHKEEIFKCASDIHYFKDNYVKIKTKEGINFPDLRPYQDDFINRIIPDKFEDNIGLMPRQSGKSISTAIYLAHCFIFKKDINIGIVGNKGKQAIEFLNNTKNILIELPIWLQMGVSVWNKGSIEGENSMRILTDVPTSDAFRGFTIAILIIDECAFIKPTIWEEFSDSIFPSQSGLSWKKNIILSTANGMNHFYKMVKDAKDGLNGANLIEVDWKDVPRYRADGTLISPEDFMNSVIRKHGSVYFSQNYGNNFIGSSHTLVSAEKLSELSEAKRSEIQHIRDGKLKIYIEPEKNHKYIIAVDPAKDGRDAFAVQIVDITSFTFVQVASAELQIDYLLMPEFIDDWGKYYNNAYLIIENNEGAGQSIADQMYQIYEYENLHFDSKIDSNSKNTVKSRKTYPGFRTTSKTRKQIIQTMKLFVENNRLVIYDERTISQLERFILIDNKYQADNGAKDDMVLALAIIFVPFINIKNFEDMRSLVKELYKNEPQEEELKFSDMLLLGNFDDFTDEEYNIPKREYEESFGIYYNDFE
jgi:hypothetical protein